ncbi:MAG: secretin N-terminal domain-containing protein [Luteolibacter sp.]
MSFHRTLALLLLGIATVLGQDAPAPPVVPPVIPPPPPGVPIPGIPPAAPAGAPAAAQPAQAPGVPLGETKIIADINEPKLSGTALAGLYRKYTGKRVIVSAAAATAEFSFVQEATPQDPLTFADAAELLRKAATIENFVFVPDAEDPNLDILTLSTGGLRPTGRGVAVYNENDTLPAGDAVISYVMTLNYIKPAEAVNTFTQIIGQFGAFGSIAAVPNASAVVVTENTSLIRRLIELKTEIDKPGSVQGTRFIKVKYSDVTELADTLTTLLTAQQATQKTAGIQRIESAPAAVPGGAPAPGGAAAGGGGSGEDIPIQIIPDPRTNRIVAMGRPIDLITVESLVREFDVETSEKNFLRRKLRFLTVSEFLPVAEDALTRAFSGTGGGGGSSGGSTQGGASGGAQSGTRTQSGSSSSRQSGSSSRNSSTGANFGGSNSSSGFGGGGSSGGGGGGDALNAPEVSSAPESVLVGRTLLVADNITNSIVVQGPPSGLEIIERLLDQIDVKPEQVMISTVIGQLTLNNSKEFGVDYLVRSGDITSRGGGGFGSILPIVPIVGEDGVETTFDPGSLSGAGLRAYGTIGDLSVYLKALQSKTDFTVLSRPSIFTSNNQKGTISSGERIAIPTSNNNFSGGGSSTNIEYQDVVLKLEVIPLVNSDNEITMKIALLNDEQNGNQIIQGAGGDGGDLSVPRISTREVLTTATVPNGQTIVLGGLIVGRNSQERSGIPILSDIPYLGKLFGNTVNTDDRSELMVFIQPSVVNNDRSLGSVQADMDSRYKGSQRVRDFADGPGVLPPVDAIAPVADKGMSRPTSNWRPSRSVAPAMDSAAPAKAKATIRSAPNR